MAPGIAPPRAAEVLASAVAQALDAGPPESKRDLLSEAGVLNATLNVSLNATGEAESVLDALQRDGMRMKGHLHEMLAVFLVGLVCVLLLQCVCVGLHRTLLGSRRGEDGWLVAEFGPRWGRRACSLLLFTFFVLPLGLGFITIVLAVIYGQIEGWGFKEATSYTIQVVSDPSQPLASGGPNSPTGDLLDYVTVMLVYVITGSTSGLVATTGFVTQAMRLVSPTWCGLGRCMFVYIPLAMSSIVVGSGFFLAHLEGWKPFEGALYMASSILRLATPLSDVTLTTDFGKFFDILSRVWDVSLCSALVALSQHPKAVGFVQALEGRLAEEVVAEVVSEGKALLEKGTGSQGCLEEVVARETEELMRLQSLVLEQQWKVNHLTEELTEGPWQGGHDAGGSGDWWQGFSGEPDPRWDPRPDPFLPGKRQRPEDRDAMRSRPMMRPQPEDTDSDDGGLC
mmetsp:Transcript_64295/g.179822  ORF Transcript_64295/g.179822 Transcript_64295/m.179822 type:complete len:454 (+) Transcript_64295:77-1438(+)